MSKFYTIEFCVLRCNQLNLLYFDFFKQKIKELDYLLSLPEALKYHSFLKICFIIVGFQCLANPIIYVAKGSA